MQSMRLASGSLVVDVHNAEGGKESSNWVSIVRSKRSELIYRTVHGHGVSHQPFRGLLGPCHALYIHHPDHDWENECRGHYLPNSGGPIRLVVGTKTRCGGHMHLVAGPVWSSHTPRRGYDIGHVVTTLGFQFGTKSSRIVVQRPLKRRNAAMSPSHASPTPAVPAGCSTHGRNQNAGRRRGSFGCGP